MLEHLCHNRAPPACERAERAQAMLVSHTFVRCSRRALAVSVVYSFYAAPRCPAPLRPAPPRAGRAAPFAFMAFSVSSATETSCSGALVSVSCSPPVSSRPALHLEQRERRDVDHLGRINRRRVAARGRGVSAAESLLLQELLETHVGWRRRTRGRSATEKAPLDRAGNALANGLHRRPPQTTNAGDVSDAARPPPAASASSPC